MDRLYEICEKNDITVIEDCAHAMGVTWRGEQLGNRAKVSSVDYEYVKYTSYIYTKVRSTFFASLGAVKPYRVREYRPLCLFSPPSTFFWNLNL